jgi:uncharacterized protein YjbI with pentapeptide repeats
VVVGCDLRGADLRDVDLREATFSHTDLRGADLTDAHLEGARGDFFWDDATRWPADFRPT